MTGKRLKHARAIICFLAVLLAAQACAAVALADDAEQLKRLPGSWVFTLDTEEQAAEEETSRADLAFLTLEENGKMSLLCNGRDGAYVCSFQGVWSAEFVPDGMDRLTLLFTETDHPAHEGSAYSVECVYSFYTESWVEQDTQHIYLLLEEAEAGAVSPFAEVYGEDGEWNVALHREQGPNMRVIRCKDYVSLREKRSASSKRLAKVPLGAAVLAFPEAGGENGFTWCVYHDTYGYILTEYLAPVE